MASRIVYKTFAIILQEKREFRGFLVNFAGWKPLIG